MAEESAKETGKAITPASPLNGENKNFIEDEIDKDLAAGVYDHVCTRFPPEPNGYLHIGHAKSILLSGSALISAVTCTMLPIILKRCTRSR